MQLGQFLARFGEGFEIRGKRNPRQFPFEIISKPFPVTGMMQQAVDVVEDVPLADAVVLIMTAKLLPHPVGDVLAA